LAVELRPVGAATGPLLQVAAQTPILKALARPSIFWNRWLPGRARVRNETLYTSDNGSGEA